MYQGISVDKTFNQSTSSLSRNDKLYCFNYQDPYDLNMQNHFEVYIEVQNTSIDTMYRGNRQKWRLRT